MTLVHALDDDQIRQLHALYSGEWWCKDRTLQDIRKMLLHCDLLFALIDSAQNHLAAFARVLTDFVYKATVFDVIVRPDQRGTGLGAQLMDAIVEHPSLRDVRSIELYCLPEMAPFYARWGFSADIGGVVLLRRAALPR